MLCCSLKLRRADRVVFIEDTLNAKVADDVTMDYVIELPYIGDFRLFHNVLLFLLDGEGVQVVWFEDYLRCDQTFRCIRHTLQYAPRIWFSHSSLVCLLL